MTEKASPRSYLPIDGIPAYDREVRAMLFGAESDAIRAGRAVTVQALVAPARSRSAPTSCAASRRAHRSGSAIPAGRTTGRCSRARLHRQHLPLLRRGHAGPRLRRHAREAHDPSRGAIVLLHACCHNPTGVDPTPAQWDEIIAIVRARGLVPFADLAYQGFGDGLDADGAVVRKLAATPGPLLVSSSFSKSFSLYGERVGALSVVGGDKDEAGRVLSQLKRLIRSNYSNPPTHGGQIVTTVLCSPELRALWEAELATMRDRIKLMRATLVELLHERVPAPTSASCWRSAACFPTRA